MKLWKTIIATVFMTMLLGMTVCAEPAQQATAPGVTPEGVISVFQSTSGKLVTIQGYNGYNRTFTVPDYTVLPQAPKERVLNPDGSGKKMMWPYVSYSPKVDERMAVYRDMAVAGIQEHLYAVMSGDYTGVALMRCGDDDDLTTAQENYERFFKKDYAFYWGKKVTGPEMYKHGYDDAFTSNGISPLGAKIVAVSVEEDYDYEKEEIVAFCIDVTGKPFTVSGTLEWDSNPVVTKRLYETDAEYRRLKDLANPNEYMGGFDPVTGWSYKMLISDRRYQIEDEIRAGLTAADFRYGYGVDPYYDFSAGWTTDGF